MRRRDALFVLGLPLAGSLASCGGGDDNPPVCREFLCLPEGPVAELTWDSAQYLITTTSTSTEPATVDALLQVHGYGVFAGLTIEVTPNGPAANPSCDGRYQTVDSDPQDAHRFIVPVWPAVDIDAANLASLQRALGCAANGLHETCRSQMPADGRDRTLAVKANSSQSI